MKFEFEFKIFTRKFNKKSLQRKQQITSVNARLKCEKSATGKECVFYASPVECEYTRLFEAICSIKCIFADGRIKH